jgi:hypothetical protein
MTLAGDLITVADGDVDFFLKHNHCFCKLKSVLSHSDMLAPWYSMVLSDDGIHRGLNVGRMHPVAYVSNET